MRVIRVQLSAEDDRRIRELAVRWKMRKSTLARELMLGGLKYKTILEYREGKASLSTVSGVLGLNLSETIDLLSDFGLEAPIDYEDYLAGAATARKSIR